VARAATCDALLTGKRNHGNDRRTSLAPGWVGLLFAYGPLLVVPIGLVVGAVVAGSGAGSQQQ
jgi:hypothetical protein